MLLMEAKSHMIQCLAGLLEASEQMGAPLNEQDEMMEAFKMATKCIYAEQYRKDLGYDNNKV